jgi:hypothetical protein
MLKKLFQLGIAALLVTGMGLGSITAQASDPSSQCKCHSCECRTPCPCK